MTGRLRGKCRQPLVTYGRHLRVALFAVIARKIIITPDRTWRWRSRVLATLALSTFLGTTHAGAPLVFRTSSYQGPVQGGPGDLLMIAGDALQATDRVVYQAAQVGGS
jgi:hypothetical protein